MRIAGRGLDFAWTRTYRSLPESADRHWDHAYALRVEATRGGIRLCTGTGGADLYRPDAGGDLHRAWGFRRRTARLSKAIPIAVLRRWRVGVPAAWTDLPAPGRIARIVDRNGNALRFGYDEAGRLEVVTDTLGRDIRLGYDRAGRLATLTDFTGRRVSYRYTAHGDLASVTYPAVTGTPTGNDFPDGATILYTYSAPHRLAGITDRAGEPLLDIEYAKSFDHERVSSLRWARTGNPVHITYHPTDEATVLAQSSTTARKRPRSAVRQTRRVRRRPRVHRAGRCGQAHHPHREPAGPPGACRRAAVLRDPLRLRQS